MAKSRGRKFAEITSPTSGVFDLTSVPTITNAKLQNSAMTLAGSSVSLGGTGVADTDALSEGSSNLYFTDARVQTFLGGGTLAGNVVVPDNRSIYLGSNSDFRLVHNTTNTQLINATGQLQITSNGGFAVTGAATFSSTITATGNIIGTLGTAAQTNITSVGTLTGLAVAGDATITKESPAFTLTDSSSSRTLLHFVDDNNSVVRASGPLLLQSGGAVSALTLDASQNATFAGTASFSGSVTATGVTVGNSNLGSNSSHLANITLNNNGYIGSANATTALQIQTSGNVGIAGLLGVNKSVNTAVALSVGADSTATNSYGLEVTNASANTRFLVNGLGDSFFYKTDNAIGMKFDSTSGRFGIGPFSGTPNSPLHILGDLGTSVSAVVRIRGTNATARTTRLQFEDYNGTIADGLIDFVIPNAGSTTGGYLGMGFNQSAQIKMLATGAIEFGGNVGIGTASPAQTLHVSSTGSTSNGIRISNSEGSFEARVDQGEFYLYDVDDNRIPFLINTSGHTIIGNASHADDNLYLVRSNAGKQLRFFRGSTECGSIAALSSAGIVIAAPSNNGAGLAFNDNANIIYPAQTQSGAAAVADNAIDLGTGGVRFQDVFATNGTIQTSDRNEKQDIEALSDAEQRVAVAAKGLLRKFRWKSAVEEKGDDARIHFGIIAQDLQAAFEAEGLDAARYAMFCSDTWTDEETSEERTRLGVRYSELLAFIISAI